MLTPAFFFHWKLGEVPAFTGIAVKVSTVLAQNEVAKAVMLTEGVISGLTVILIELEVSLLGIAQPKLDVNTTVNESLWLIVEGVNTLVSVPIFTPFFFH